MHEKAKRTRAADAWETQCQFDEPDRESWHFVMDAVYKHTLASKELQEQGNQLPHDYSQCH